MRTTISGLGFRSNHWGNIKPILGIMKKEHGNCYSILGLYWENGKDNGSYYNLVGLGV